MSIEVANPSIEQVLEAFLREERLRLGATTWRQYENAVEILAVCLNAYGHQILTAEEQTFLETGGGRPARDCVQFIHLFGPERILDYYGEVFGWFLPRKVFPGKARTRAIGAALKRLAKWLAEKGHVDDGRAREVVEDTTEYVRELVAAEDLLTLLERSARPVQAYWEEAEGTFKFVRVEGADVWLEEFGGNAYGPIHLSREVAGRCPIGWSLHGTLGRRGKTWSIADVWRVMPDA